MAIRGALKVLIYILSRRADVCRAYSHEPVLDALCVDAVCAPSGMGRVAGRSGPAAGLSALLSPAGFLSGHRIGFLSGREHRHGSAANRFDSAVVPDATHMTSEGAIFSVFALCFPAHLEHRFALIQRGGLTQFLFKLSLVFGNREGIFRG